MKKSIRYLILSLVMVLGTTLGAEVIEKIYAVVENEIITRTEYLKREQASIAQLSAQYEGEELDRRIQEVRKSLLDQIIDQKLLLAKAKTKDYDVDSDVEVMLAQIKKNYNFNSDEEFKKVLNAQGVRYEEYLQFLREQRLTERLVYEEVEPRINIDASEILGYYRDQRADYRIPPRIKLNAVFLNQEYYLTEEALKARQEEIARALSEKDFLSVANEYTQLDSEENPGYLGEFKVEELDDRILGVARTLQEGEYSDRWIQTGTGYYLIQVVERIPEKMQEYSKVRDQIYETLHQQAYNREFQNYVQNLREESHIKIYRDAD